MPRPLSHDSEERLTSFALCWLLGTSVQKRGGKLGGADWHGVYMSEWTVFNFILSHTLASQMGREDKVSLKSLFSERMSQVASTACSSGTTASTTPSRRPPGSVSQASSHRIPRAGPLRDHCEGRRGASGA